MTSVNGALLQVSGLSCVFGGVHAVEGVSFDVMPRSAVGVIGPNGAGKTTLFNLICGFVRPTSGRVQFNGATISGPPYRVARAGIGRTFQTVRVFGELSVLDNLLVADSLVQVRDESTFADRAHDALDFVGMTKFSESLAGSLSYGQQKLVEIAVVLMNRPKLILLDEPVAGVNPTLIDRITVLLRGLVERGLTLLVVEHNVPFVADLCDRVVVMSNGRKLMEGTGAEVQKDRRVLEAFLGG